MIKSAKLYFLTIFALLTLILVAVSWSQQHGPRPKAADGPDNQFSAMRAFTLLEEMVGNNQPHPSGSAENARIRDLLTSKLEALGYAVEIQAELACTLHYPGCTQVENIIARLKGSGNGDAIMLTTHYDSVPAGPAAADDGAGTAALLEVARIAKQDAKMKNDIIFLITDGEEGGLRGAAAFAKYHPDFKDVKLVINMESRGASGPSSMFETSAGNLELVKTFASNNKHPVATSLAYEVYQRIPNDTDYSIYKEKGVAGLNFAFVVDVHLYHSALDDVAHLDKASLQHHGDNALAAVRAFGNKDLNTLIGTSNASYIDVFGQFVLVWPAGLNLPLALLSLVLLVIVLLKARPQKLGGSFGAVLTILVLIPVMGGLLSFPLGVWPDLFYLDHPYPWAGRLSFILSVLTIVWSVIFLLRNRVSYNGLAWGTAFIFTLPAIAASILIPGVAYLFLFPALAASIGFIIDMLRRHERAVIGAHLGLFVGAYMAFYHLIVLEIIAPYDKSYMRILPLILVALPLASLFVSKNMDKQRTNKRTGIAFAGATLLVTLIASLLPGFNAAHPRTQNLVYMDGFETGKAQWVSTAASDPDPIFLDKAGFDINDKAKNHYGLLWMPGVRKETSTGKFLPPKYNYISNSVTDGILEVQMDIQSTNSGYGLFLGFDKNNAPKTVHVNGRLAADYTAKSYRRPLAIRGPSNDVFHITLTLAPGQVFNMALIDAVSLKPAQLDGMADMRSDMSHPLHSGDRALIALPITIDCTNHCNNQNNQ